MPIITPKQSQLFRPSYDLTNGLVGWWTFDDGTARDLSGRQNHGTIVGSPRPTSGFVPDPEGRTGALGNFSTANYVNIASTNLTTAFTICGWVRLANTTPYQALFDTGTNSSRWYINAATDNARISITKRAVADYPASAGVTVNQWTHIAVVKDGDTGTNVFFYINGVPRGTAAAGSFSTGTGGGRIGAWAESAANPISGPADDIRLYNRALAPGEIHAIYASAFHSIDNLISQVSYFSPYKTGVRVETAAASDAVSLQLTQAGSAVETATASDAATIAATLVAANGDALTSTDALDVQATLAGTLAETASLVDATAFTTAAAALVSETAALTDAASVQATLASALAETADLVDATTLGSVSSAALAETTALTDTAAASTVLSTSVAEMAAIADTTAVSAIFPISLVEPATATDAVSSELLSPFGVAETLAATDQVASTAVYTSGLAESAAATDATNGSTAASTFSVTDALSIGDAFTVSLVRSGSVAEALAATDAAAPSSVISTSISVSANAADLVGAGGTVTVSLLELNVLVDTPVVSARFQGSVSESGSAQGEFYNASVYLEVVVEHAPVTDVVFGATPQNDNVSEVAGSLTDVSSAAIYRFTLDPELMCVRGEPRLMRVSRKIAYANPRKRAC